MILAPTFANVSGLHNNFRLQTYLEPVFLELGSSSSITELDYKSSSVGSEDTLHALQQSIPNSYDFSAYTNALL